MATFQLKNATDTFDLDHNGGVAQAGASVGTWNTNAQKKIVVTKSDGTTVAFDVAWAVNGFNQLVLSAGGTDIVNFSTIAGTRPLYNTKNAALEVFPDIKCVFFFTLHGVSAMSSHHSLQFTVSGKTSTINGFIQDPRGRFMYHFFNKQDQL